MAVKTRSQKTLEFENERVGDYGDGHEAKYTKKKSRCSHDVLLQKLDMRESSIYANDGVVPPGLARLSCLPSAEALGLIVSSSGLGPCFTSDRDVVSFSGPGRCRILGSRPVFHAQNQAAVASSRPGPVSHPREQAGVS